MATSRKVVLMVLLLALFAAGCGGDDGETTVTETVTETDPSLVPPETKPEQTVPEEVRNLRASCRITIVTSQKGKNREKVLDPFFCKSAKQKVQPGLPRSPFGAKDECRLDVNVGSLYRSELPDPVTLDDVAPRLTKECTKIYLVVYALGDEDVLEYSTDAPLTKGPVKPGQKGKIDLSL